ncbi:MULTISPECIES: FAD-dependent monooxygenase [unclassified Streptomyces]|uniref:FAD-dependent monooxygenase n=1 Tax=unclassified Streptomyces TaxID=2593676 RepID=UPI0022B70365|nr:MULTISPECIES: FAD-dependent monooxygenase [unclassified Streptomyces]MCZ7416534.1 FAD-dependent monooxygenase [Streptomyces sp. WMMC897]MCZ7433655.1 FAD-dependent monooxygenase [Streptomyces sp. WMMC1477]
MRGGSVAVVGGSIAGCAAALAVARGGAGQVTVFERTAGALRDRGVGITLQRERYTELRDAGYVDDGVPWLPMSRRVWSVRDGDAPLGRTIAIRPFHFRAYNWGTLWSGLRRRVPEGARYRSGTTVTAVEPGAEGATLRLADGSTERFDAVVGADGYRSAVRAALFPDSEGAPRYAGYLAWRGTSPPVDTALWAEGDCHTVVFPGGHCMIYRIPDPVEGHRVNWVLYAAPPEPPGGPDAATWTAASLPPGRLGPALTAYLRDLVTRRFAPFWAECLLRSPAESMFAQPIHDVEVPAYAAGRVLLTGDAATVARPHTGGGSVKALQDATALEAAWRAGDGWPAVTGAYDADRTAVGRAMVALGRRLGRAQVEETPDWSTMGEAELDAWWRELTGAGAGGTLGGVALDRR